MYFWQGEDICNDGRLKYQNGGINKPGQKRKLSLLEELFVLVRIEMFLFELSERFDASVTLISKTCTTWINCIKCFPFPLQKFSEKVFTNKFRKIFKNANNC